MVVRISVAAVLFLLLAFGKETEVPALKITPLTSNCYIYTSYDWVDGTFFPANGLYIVTTGGVLLVDSPWTETHTQQLIDSVDKKHGKKITFCISTHFHADRTGGLDVLKKHGTKTWASKQTKELCIQRKEKQPEFTFEKDTVFNFGDISLETFYPGKGHSPDNIVIWVKEKKILHGGCFVKSVESKGLGNLGDADVAEWKKSVQKVMKKYPKPDFIIPGHFGWKNKKSLKHTYQLLSK